VISFFTLSGPRIGWSTIRADFDAELCFELGFALALVAGFLPGFARAFAAGFLPGFARAFAAGFLPGLARALAARFAAGFLPGFAFSRFFAIMPLLA
jgi:hypothetical protein